MERFAVIVALIIAGGFAIAAVAGPAHIGIHFGDDEGRFEAAAPVSPDQIVNVEETVFAASALETVDAAILLEVIPEDRADIAVSIQNAGPLATPQVRQDGSTVVIDGGLGARVSCHGEGDVVVHGRGGVDLAQLPIVRVRMPRTVTLEGGNGGGLIRVGDAQSLQLTIAGCGDAEIGAVAQTLSLQVEGSGDIRVQQANEAQLELAGSGDVVLTGPVSQLQVSLDGSSSLEVSMAAGGAARLEMNGSGDMRLQGGPLTQLEAILDGSGDIEFDGSVTGPAEARINGSGDIEISGTVDTLNATVEGSGSVDVGGVRGAQTRVVRGSGDIQVGDGAMTAPVVRPPAPPAPQPIAPAPAPLPPLEPAP